MPHAYLAPSIEETFSSLGLGLDPTLPNLVLLYGGLLFVNVLIVLLITRLRGFSVQGGRKLLVLVTIAGLVAPLGPLGVVLGIPLVLGTFFYSALGRPL